MTTITAVVGAAMAVSKEALAVQAAGDMAARRMGLVVVAAGGMERLPGARRRTRTPARATP